MMRMRCSCSLASPRWRSHPHQAAEAGALFLPITTAAARANNHRRSVSTLILLRHGQSQWNGPDSRFTGWCDIPLTVRGRVEAVAAGQLMRSRGFKARRVCIAFASDLQRSHETCELVCPVKFCFYFVDLYTNLVFPVVAGLGQHGGTRTKYVVLGTHTT